MIFDAYENRRYAQMNNDLYEFRISQVVEELMAKEDVFRERLHRTGIITDLTNLMKILPPEKFVAIKDEEFRQLVGKCMAHQLVHGLLDAKSI